jgi:phage terminase large subunit-like protein
MRSPTRWSASTCSSSPRIRQDGTPSSTAGRELYGDVVIDYPTNQRQRMSAACDRFRVGVLEGDLSHDGSAVLARHLGHCVAKDTPYGQLVTKDAADSPRKIDAAVAAIIAYDRAMWHAAKPTPEFSFAFA